MGNAQWSTGDCKNILYYYSYCRIIDESCCFQGPEVGKYSIVILLYYLKLYRNPLYMHIISSNSEFDDIVPLMILYHSVTCICTDNNKENIFSYFKWWDEQCCIQRV